MEPGGFEEVERIRNFGSPKHEWGHGFFKSPSAEFPFGGVAGAVVGGLEVI